MRQFYERVFDVFSKFAQQQLNIRCESRWVCVVTVLRRGMQALMVDGLDGAQRYEGHVNL